MQAAKVSFLPFAVNVKLKLSIVSLDWMESTQEYTQFSLIDISETRAETRD